MPCHVRGSSVSRRRAQYRQPASQPPPSLALLDLGKPGERQAHDFLLRATSQRDRMWKLISLRRRGDVLLCVVCWMRPKGAAKRFSLAEVKLTETAVFWRGYRTAEAAKADMVRRCEDRDRQRGAV